MPKVRRQELPEALLRHLLARVRQREISHEQIVLLAQWLDANPEVPEETWFKKFSGMIVCETRADTGSASGIENQAIKIKFRKRKVACGGGGRFFNCANFQGRRRTVRVRPRAVRSRGRNA